MPLRSSCGRAITWTLTTSPIRLAAAAPASTAAFTAATSPATKAVTRPLPILSQPMRSTLAAFSIASLASTRATNPLHSIMPSASTVELAITGSLAIRSDRRMMLPGRVDSSLDERDPGRVRQVAAVGLVGVDVDLQLPVGVGPHQQALQRGGAGALHPEVHPVLGLHAVIRGVLRPHVDMPLGLDDAPGQHQAPRRADQEAAGRPLDVAGELHGDVEPQADRVGDRQFDLAERPARAQD